MANGFTIARADLSAADIAALIAAHADFCDRTAPPESCHRLTIDALTAPDILVWAAHDDAGMLLGVGALKLLSDADGEIKSMHTGEAARGRGVGRAMLAVIIAEAQERGLQALWLETGVHDLFAPARHLYLSEGFAECPPFASYVADPHSVFMHRPLL